MKIRGFSRRSRTATCASSDHGHGSRNADGGQRRATREGVNADALDLGRDNEGRERRASVEGEVSDGGDTGRQGDGRESRATGERGLTDGGQRLGQHDLRKARAILERVGAQRGSTRDRYGGERRRNGLGVVIRGVGAEDIA